MALVQLADSVLLIPGANSQLSDLSYIITLTISLINAVEPESKFRDDHKLALLQLQTAIDETFNYQSGQPLSEDEYNSARQAGFRQYNTLVHDYRSNSEQMKNNKEHVAKFKEIWEYHGSTLSPEDGIDIIARISAEEVIAETVMEARKSGNKPDSRGFLKKLAKIFPKTGGGIGQFRILPCPQYIPPGQEEPRFSTDLVLTMTRTASFGGTTREGDEDSVRDANYSLDG